MDIEAAAQVASGGKAGVTVHDNARIRYAVIEGTTVVNMIIGPENWAPDGMVIVVVPDNGLMDIGWSFSGGEFAPPV